MDEPVADYIGSVEGLGGIELQAVYLVGGAALGDFSARQSNIDLVVVTDPELPPDRRDRLRRAERKLGRAGRPAGLWYATWDAIAEGSPAGSGSGLDTPLTRALLAEDAIALTGPDWPVVAFDQAVLQSWCHRQLRQLAADATGPMILRRGVAPLVLQAARLAEGAVNGRVLSKSEAGESALALVPKHYRRILNDSVGYRRGANTSMYWGPFERKTDARELIRHLVLAAGG